MDPRKAENYISPRLPSKRRGTTCKERKIGIRINHSLGVPKPTYAAFLMCFVNKSSIQNNDLHSVAFYDLITR